MNRHHVFHGGSTTANWHVCMVSIVQGILQPHSVLEAYHTAMCVCGRIRGYQFGPTISLNLCITPEALIATTNYVVPISVNIILRSCLCAAVLWWCSLSVCVLISDSTVLEQTFLIAFLWSQHHWCTCSLNKEHHNARLCLFLKCYNI